MGQKRKELSAGKRLCGWYEVRVGYYVGWRLSRWSVEFRVVQLWLHPRIKFLASWRERRWFSISKSQIQRVLWPGCRWHQALESDPFFKSRRRHTRYYTPRVRC